MDCATFEGENDPTIAYVTVVVPDQRQSKYEVEVPDNETIRTFKEAILQRYVRTLPRHAYDQYHMIFLASDGQETLLDPDEPTLGFAKLIGGDDCVIIRMSRNLSAARPVHAGGMGAGFTFKR